MGAPRAMGHFVKIVLLLVIFCDPKRFLHRASKPTTLDRYQGQEEAGGKVIVGGISSVCTGAGYTDPQQSAGDDLRAEPPLGGESSNPRRRPTASPPLTINTRVW